MKNYYCNTYNTNNNFYNINNIPSNSSCIFLAIIILYIILAILTDNITNYIIKD